MDTVSPDTDESVSGVAAVKLSESWGSHRITPPLPVREAVDMQKDEAWSWFWHPEEDRFYLRRSSASLGGIPDEVQNYGVAEARENGRYLDFAIPTEAVDDLGIEKGDSWRFTADDDHTIHMDRE